MLRIKPITSTATLVVLCTLLILLAACQPARQATIVCPDLSKDCILEGDLRKGVSVRSVEMPAVMKPFQLMLTLHSQLVLPSEVLVSFGMEGMEMGLNRYKMQQRDANTWVAEVTLPVCVRGRADWLMQLEMTTGPSKASYRVAFQTNQ